MPQKLSSFTNQYWAENLQFSKKFKDGPPMENASEADAEKVMHVALPLSNGNVLMASDFTEAMNSQFVAGNNFSISIGAESKEEADKIFNGLSSGGTVTMPLQDTFWGAYFGMFVDKFGINWLVNYDTPQQ